MFTGVLNARLELEDRGLKYVCGEVELDEGPSINAVILGINKKKAREIDGNFRCGFDLYFMIWADIQLCSLSWMSNRNRAWQ